MLLIRTKSEQYYSRDGYVKVNVRVMNLKRHPSPIGIILVSSETHHIIVSVYKNGYGLRRGKKLQFLHRNRRTNMPIKGSYWNYQYIYKQVVTIPPHAIKL